MECNSCSQPLRCLPGCDSFSRPGFRKNRMDRSLPTATHESASTRASAVIYSGVFLTGMLTTLLGPLLPVLSARWSLADAQAGYLFTALFAGSMGGAVISGLLLPRHAQVVAGERG